MIITVLLPKYHYSIAVFNFFYWKYFLYVEFIP